MIKLCHSHHTILQIIPHCWYILQRCTRRRRNSFEAVFLHGATFFKYLTVLGYLFQYLILGFPGSFPLFGAKNKTQSQLSCRLNFSLNCSLVFPIYLPSVPFSQEHQAFLVISAFLLFPQILLPPSSCHLQQCS